MPSSPALATLALVVACGAPAPQGVSDGAVGGEVDGLLVGLAEVWCEARAACELPLHRPFDVASCAEDARAEMAPFERALREAIDAGRVTFDARRTEDLLSALRGRGCDLDLAELPARMLAGSAATGTACHLDLECAQRPARCVRAEPEALVGRCALPEPEGETCNLDLECAWGTVCVDTTCVRESGDGDSCGDGNAPPCGPGLACVGGDAVEEVAGRCALVSELVVGGVGEPCGPGIGSFCAEGLACVASACDDDGCAHVCAPAPGPGAACQLGFLPFDPCPRGQHCAVPEEVGEALPTGVCVDDAVEGDACGAASCAQGLVCIEGPLARCGQPLPLAAPCSDDEECGSGLCDDGTCERPRWEEVRWWLEAD